MLRGKDISKWKVEWSPDRSYDRYVLYPHEKKEGGVRNVNLKDYPNTKRYLESHKEKLEERHYLTEAGREWFEIWVHQDPEYFERQFKIMTPDFSNHNCFAMDAQKYYIGSSALAIILQDQAPEFNYYVLAWSTQSLSSFSTSSTRQHSYTPAGIGTGPLLHGKIPDI